jgi:hypothetical protein
VVVLLLEFHATPCPVLPEYSLVRLLLAYLQDMFPKDNYLYTGQRLLVGPWSTRVPGPFGGLAISVEVLPSYLGLLRVSVKVSPCLGAPAFPG